LIDKIKVLRLHGMSKSAIDRHTKYAHWNMGLLGYKSNMFDIQASLLINQLNRLESQWKKREKIASKYEAAFRRSGIEFPKTAHGAKHARHLFTVWSPAKNRDENIRKLQNSGIGVAVNYNPPHMMKFYRRLYGYKKGDLPNAEHIGKRTISIPLYPSLADKQVDYVIQKVKSYIGSGHAVSA